MQTFNLIKVVTGQNVLIKTSHREQTNTFAEVLFHYKETKQELPEHVTSFNMTQTLSSKTEKSVVVSSTQFSYLML